MEFPRRSGIILHPTSLPGRFGIGDLGDAAYQVASFLTAAGQTYWQVLPLSPTGYGDSPYQALSAFAGNPMLISPERLLEQGDLIPDDMEGLPSFRADCVDFGPVIHFKTNLLDRAYSRFQQMASADRRQSLDSFVREQAHWLDDFALFMALKEAHGLRPWREWESELATRQPEALNRAREQLADKIERVKYQQWQFFQQWFALKAYANGHGISIIGDLPLYVSEDSADVWSHPDLFQFDKNLRSKVVAGVPPDYFSETGQLWGNPIYRWRTMAQNGYVWWISRFRWAYSQADVVRIDHFRGFYNYWEVPGGEPTAVKGRWVRGPGAPLFRAVTHALGNLALIAEDLGDFDPPSRAGVDALQTEFGFPGMRVLQFAFGDGPTAPFLPHNYPHNVVVYTGTHDNDTMMGWYQVTSTEKERDYARRYLARDGSDIAWDFIRVAWGSVANTAIAPAQDLLSLGHSTRMNTPSTAGAPNWCWRLLPGALNEGIAARLGEMTEIYGRRAPEDRTTAKER